MHKKPSSFLKLPEYPGGKEQLKKFIRQHLKYPRKAIENQIEGIVLLSAEISDNGDVSDIRIEKGIGYGCDEEAARVLSLMKFGGVKNRGVRVKTRRKFKIPFKLLKKQNQVISYNWKKNTKPTSDKKATTYSYTVKLGGSDSEN